MGDQLFKKCQIEERLNEKEVNMLDTKLEDVTKSVVSDVLFVMSTYK